MKRPAVFLDRDGTIVEEVNYLSRVEDVRLFPYAVEAIRILKNLGYLIIVVTNQSGIGRGIYSEEEMHSIHNEIQTGLGGTIDGFYFCPHVPAEECDCRKPFTGMIDAACVDNPIDLTRSWMVGDKNIDVETGHKAGVLTILVATGYGAEHKGSLKVQPHVFARDLREAAKHIANVSQSA